MSIKAGDIIPTPDGDLYVEGLEAVGGGTLVHTRRLSDDPAMILAIEELPPVLRSVKTAVRADAESIPDKYDPDWFVPPKDVQAAAARGRELAQEKQGEGGQVGTATGGQRAAQLATGARVSPDIIRRMRSYFQRHDSYEKETNPPSNGYISWMRWGGDPGKRWAESVYEKMQNADEREDAKSWEVVKAFCKANGRDLKSVFKKGQWVAFRSGDESGYGQVVDVTGDDDPVAEVRVYDEERELLDERRIAVGFASLRTLDSEALAPAIPPDYKGKALKRIEADHVVVDRIVRAMASEGFRATNEDRLYRWAQKWWAHWSEHVMDALAADPRVPHRIQALAHQVEHDLSRINRSAEPYEVERDYMADAIQNGKALARLMRQMMKGIAPGTLVYVKSLHQQARVESSKGGAYHVRLLNAQKEADGYAVTTADDLEVRSEKAIKKKALPSIAPAHVAGVIEALDPDAPDFPDNLHEALRLLRLYVVQANDADSKAALQAIQRTATAWGEADREGAIAGIEEALRAFAPEGETLDNAMRSLVTGYNYMKSVGDIAAYENATLRAREALTRTTRHIKRAASVKAAFSQLDFASDPATAEIYLPDLIDDFKATKRVVMRRALARTKALEDIAAALQSVENAESLDPDQLTPLIQKAERVQGLCTTDRSRMTVISLLMVLRRAQRLAREMGGLIRKGDAANDLYNALAQARHTATMFDTRARM